MIKNTVDIEHLSIKFYQRKIDKQPSTLQRAWSHKY